MLAAARAVVEGSSPGKLRHSRANVGPGPRSIGAAGSSPVAEANGRFPRVAGQCPGGNETFELIERKIRVAPDLPGSARLIEQRDGRSKVIRSLNQQVKVPVVTVGHDSPPIIDDDLLWKCARFRPSKALTQVNLRTAAAPPNRETISGTGSPQPTRNMLRNGAKHNLDFIRRNESGAAAFGGSVMIGYSRSGWTAVAIALAALLPQAARAQYIAGAIGPQSRATIAIRVSVSPRVLISRAAAEGIEPQQDGIKAAGAIAVSSNARGLRLRLVEAGTDQPHRRTAANEAGRVAPILSAAGERQPGASGRAPSPVVLLITPD